MAAILTRSMSFVQEEPESPEKLERKAMENALQVFKTLDRKTVIRGNPKVNLAVEDIVKYSMNNGLNPDQIKSLVDIICDPNPKISQAIRTKFVKCLIPSSKVPQSVVVRVLSWISTRIFTNPGPSNLHSILLRWILLIYDHIDNLDQLHSLYDIIFLFINSCLLMPHVCHLLYMLTRKQDVQFYKVHKILDLINKVGPEPGLIGLLTLYKVYCPHLVPMRLEHKHKVFFKAHDALWRSTIEDIVKMHQQSEDPEPLEQALATKSRRERAVFKRGAKRQKLLIPESHYAADEIAAEKKAESAVFSLLDEAVPYSHIDSFTEFLDKMDRIEYPSQIAAAFKDQRLQLLLSCHPDPVVIARLGFWLQHFFTFDFKRADVDFQRKEQLLQLLLEFSQHCQISVVQEFLESYLPSWDGLQFATLIFSLIPYTQPSTFQELQMNILDPLQKLFFASDVYFKTMYIISMTKLVSNWVLAHRQPVRIVAEQDQHTSVNADSVVCVSRIVTNAPAGPEAGVDQAPTAASGPGVAESKDNIQSILLRLIIHLDNLIVGGMRQEDDHYLLQTTALDVLDLVSTMLQKFGIPLLSLPLQVIHRLMLSDCAATLARLCKVINSYRVAFMASKSHKPLLTSVSTDPAKDSFPNHFNGLLLDILGMLWQGRLFQGRRNTFVSIFQLKPSPRLEGLLNDKALTIYSGPAFVGFAYKFLKEIQKDDHQRLHPHQIEEWKDNYLLFLERENLPEFKELVFANIKSRRKL